MANKHTPFARHVHPVFSHEQIAQRCPYFARLRGILSHPLLNVRFRRYVLERARVDRAFARDIWTMCARDLLFYLHVFGWTYATKDPYLGRFEHAPFMLWPVQIDVILSIQSVVMRWRRQEDVRILKSRDMGATYLCLWVFQWVWHFQESKSLFVMSRIEELVDDGENMKALLPKVRYAINNMPPWLRPKFENGKNRIWNCDTRSLIHGGATTTTAGQGLRDTAALNDEFDLVPGSVQEAIMRGVGNSARTRIFNSTYSDERGTPFENMGRSAAYLQIGMHWSSHPDRRLGLYRATAKAVQLFDPATWAKRSGLTVEEVRDAARTKTPAELGALLGYAFKTDDRIRSPWYDWECEKQGPRGAQNIALSLDMEKGGPSAVFPEPLMQRMREKARAPVHRGRLTFDDAATICGALQPRWLEDPLGPIMVWGEIQDGRLMCRPSVMGCDVSLGTGASNSIAVVAERGTRRELIEFAASDLSPEKFATQCTALAMWVGDCVMCWEGVGPGLTFGGRVRDLGYGNVYFRGEEDNWDKGLQSSGKAGFSTHSTAKFNAILAYLEALQMDRYVVMNDAAIDEHAGWVFRRTPSGNDIVECDGSSRPDDQSGAQALHGDRVIARMLAWFMLRQFPMTVAAQAEEKKIGRFRSVFQEAMREKASAKRDSGWW